MPKFFRYYGIQPGIRCKFDDLVILEWGQLFDHTAGQWLENYPDEVLDAECQGSDKELFECQDEGRVTLTSADPSSFQEM